MLLLTKKALSQLAIGIALLTFHKMDYGNFIDVRVLLIFFAKCI